LQQPNVQVVVDDGRNHLLMHSQQYDVITVDPAPPLYSPGTVNLYSHEFFTLCRQRLRPQGVVCVWVQPDRKSENKMIFQTFANVFEHVQVWAGPVAPHHGWLLLGSHQPLAMSKVPEKIKQLYQIPAVAADLRAWGTELAEPQNILDLYSTDREGLRALCVGAALISDDHPYTEFPLWRSLGRNPEYGEMISARPYKAAGPTVANPYE
jgi:spermidine synthase